MKRSDLVEQLARYCVFPTPTYCKAVVLLPTYDDCKVMSNEVAGKLKELPSWLNPNFIKRRTLSEIRTDTFWIMFVSNTVRLKGHTIDAIYRSSRIEMSNNEDAAFYSFISALSGRPIQEFNDN